MRYLTKFQYLSYRKVSLLYLVFILFYFFTASKDEVHHFKQLNQAVFERLADKEGEQKWQDSTAAFLQLENTASVVSYSDPNFEESEWGIEITSSLNEIWESPSAEPRDDRSLLSATEEAFESSMLPVETPNVVSSTFLALESLRKKRGGKAEEVTAEEEEGPTVEELFGPVKLQLKSIFLEGEHMLISWPESALSNLQVYRNNALLEEIAPGGSMDRVLNTAGTSTYVFSDGKDSLVRTVEVLYTSAYEFAFGKRYYHLTSGGSYVLSLHNQIFSQSNTDIASSNAQVKVQWMDDKRIRVRAVKDHFSGTASIRFRSAGRTDSLRLRFSPEESFTLGMTALDGQPTSDINQCERISLSNGSKTLVVLQGDLVVFHENGSSKLSVDRGRVTGLGNGLNKAVGIMLENSLVLDESNDRMNLEQPVIQWLN